jgi:hypothetical protein
MIRWVTTRKMGEEAPFASAAIALPFTSEGTWEHGCFEPDPSGKNQLSLAGPPLELERTNPRRIEIILSTPLRWFERINYASPLRAWTDPVL